MRSVTLYILSAAAMGLATLASVSGAEDAPTPANATAAPNATAASTLPADLEKALQLPEGGARTQALRTAAIAWERQDAHTAMEWGFTLPNNAGNTDIVKYMSNDWGGREPVPATEWVMSHSPRDGQYTMFALHIIVTAWSRIDHSAAGLWAEKQPQGSGLRRTAYFSVADGWAQIDPPAAAEWAAKLPGENDRHVALVEICSLWERKSKNPETIAAWAEKLPVGDMKCVVPGLVGSWAKTDAAKAKAWLNGLPLADADKAEIAAKIK